MNGVSKKAITLPKKPDFEITEASLKKLAKEASKVELLDLGDKEQYEVVKNTRIALKTHRVEIENRRKIIKEPALNWGRMVDDTAKTLKGIIEPEEKRLKNLEQKHQEEIDRLEREAERKRLAAIEARRNKVKATGARYNYVNECYEIGQVSVSAMEVDGAEEETLDGIVEQFQAEAERLEKIREEEAAIMAKEAELEKRRKALEREEERLKAEEQAAAQSKKAAKEPTPSFDPEQEEVHVDPAEEGALKNNLRHAIECFEEAVGHLSCIQGSNIINDAIQTTDQILGQLKGLEQ